jgi:hypothetical protein
MAEEQADLLLAGIARALCQDPAPGMRNARRSRLAFRCAAGFG